MNRRRWWLVGGMLLAAAVLAPLTLAATGLDLGWWTVDGGGGQSTGGPFALNGSLAQADAGELSGNRYGLAGGFWGGAGASPTKTPTPSPTATLTVTPSPSPTSTPTPGFSVYLPLIQR